MPDPAQQSGNAAGQAQAPTQVQTPAQAQAPAQAPAAGPVHAVSGGYNIHQEAIPMPASGPVHAVTGNVPVPASGAVGAPAPAAAPPDPEKLEALRTTINAPDDHFVHAEGPVPLMVRHADGAPAFAVLEEKLVPFDDWRKAGSPVDRMPGGPTPPRPPGP